MFRLKLLLFLCISVGISLLGFSFADNFSQDFNTYMTKVNDALQKGNANVTALNDGSVKRLIANYCSAVTSQQSGFNQSGFVYSAQQSVFVFLLCSNVGTTAGAYTSKLDGFQKGSGKYFKLTTFPDLGLTDRNLGFRDLCSPERDMNKCNISKIIPKLYNMIINDYVNLKQPNLYGLTNTSSDDKKLQEEANGFSATYFNLSICDSGSTPTAYPQSCNIMKKYLKQANNLLSDVTIFNKDALYKGNSTGYCDTSKDTYQLLRCGINGDTAYSLQGFLNLMYNEFFYYRLFASYYSVMIQGNASTILQLSPTSITDEIYDRTTTMNDEIIRSQQALSTTLRMLRDMYSAFPLHIGFLMYQEDLQGFNDDLSNLATPMYTLYGKLRNVQKP